VHAAVLGGLLVGLQTSDGIPPECAPLLLGAPLALWPFAIGPLSRLTPRGLTVARLMAVGIPLGVAVGRAAWGMKVAGQ
jgi:hypothetical protein